MTIEVTKEMEEAIEEIEKIMSGFYLKKIYYKNYLY